MKTSRRPNVPTALSQPARCARGVASSRAPSAAATCPAATSAANTATAIAGDQRIPPVESPQTAQSCGAQPHRPGLDALFLRCACDGAELPEELYVWGAVVTRSLAAP